MREHLRRRGVGGEVRRERAARVQPREHERADPVAVVAGDHDVLHVAARRAAMNRARSGPTLTQVPVESLKSSATRPSNTRPLRGSLRIDEAHRVAQPVEALLVEGRARELRLPPVAGRDVRPADAHLELVAHGRELQLDARHRAGRSCRRAHRRRRLRADVANGAVSVAPRPVTQRMRSPQVCTASSSQRVPDRLRQPGAGVEEHPDAAEELRRAARGSRRRYGSSSSNPRGTLKYTVGAISRRLRTVFSISAGQRACRRRCRACRRCRARGRSCGCRRRCGSRAASRRAPAGSSARNGSVCGDHLLVASRACAAC